MLSLNWPWLLVLLPLPWFYRRWRSPAPINDAALQNPAYAALAREAGETRRPGSRQGKLVLLSLIWLCCVVAASRPQWIGEPISQAASGRDLLLAVDISGSMEIEDMESAGGLIDRLSVVKTVVGEFVSRREGDRLGLVLFGDRAYLQSPLTFDRATVNTLLQEALIGFAGKGTAIGDAIGLGVKRLKDKTEGERVMILLTDGANTSGEVQPLQAAELAAAYKVRIYTIGVGADEILRRSLFGVQRFNPSADLDETTLQSIADQTGGRYFRARNPEQLAQIYTLLDTLEPVAREQEYFRPRRSLFHWPLGLGLLFGCALGLSQLPLKLPQRGSTRHAGEQRHV